MIPKDQKDFKVRDEPMSVSDGEVVTLTDKCTPGATAMSLTFTIN